MKLLSVILIVFVCGLSDVWGCFTSPSMTTTTEAPLVRSGPIEVFADEARTELDRLTDSGDTWTIYCCTWSRGVVERTCGSNGVDCFNTCNQMEGPRTERLAIFTGSNPRAQAEQYCAEAKAEDSSSRSGGSRSGEVKSPNYPSNYPDNSDTSTPIQVADGARIELTFVDFNIEAHASCDYDYVQVLDTSGAQLIKKCGSTVPSKIISSGNKLIVKFHSDSSVTLKGFRATWKTVTATEGGNIKSPNYPSNYPDNKVQEWNLSVAEGSKIELTFEAFELEAEANCSYDFVQVSHGSTSQKYCGSTNPGKITSTSNTMNIKFQSDYSVNAKGFNAVWKAVSA